MLRILPLRDASHGRLRLGEICTVPLERGSEALVIRAFLHHGAVLNPKPIQDWTHHDEIVFFPEAPGRYRLSIQWYDSASETSGWEELSLTVEPTGASFQPHRAKTPHGVFWTPNSQEAEGAKVYESALLDGIGELVPAGATVYDVGANLGLYAVPLARAVGESGRVICFEPNPLCVAYLQANLEANRIETARIVPMAITDGAEKVSFTINVANTLLGLSASSIFYGQKVGQEISVPGGTLAELIERFRLEPPDVVKIDVEGVEHLVLEGMIGVLAERRPLLLFEVHGPEIARLVVPKLFEIGYRFEEAGTGTGQLDAEATLERFTGGVRQLVCRAEAPNSA